MTKTEDGSRFPTLYPPSAVFWPMWMKFGTLMQNTIDEEVNIKKWN